MTCKAITVEDMSESSDWVVTCCWNAKYSWFSYLDAASLVIAVSGVQTSSNP